MNRQARVVRASVLSEQRQVKVIVSTESIGRDNLILLTGGIDLTAYRTNPVVLWQHNPDWPIAKAVDIRADGSSLNALVQFPPAGASQMADEVYELVKNGIVNAVSSGFEPKDTEPFRNDSGPGLRVKTCELQEFSFVSIPALPDALVTERARRHDDDGRAARRALAAQYARELGTDAKPPQRMAKTLAVHKRMAKPESVTQRRQMTKHRRMAALYEAELAVEDHRRRETGTKSWPRR